jgi:hypothetical protein
MRTRLTRSIDGGFGGAEGFDEAANAEVAGLAEDAVGGADDEVDGGWGEGVAAESGVVEFAEDELAHGVGIDRLAQNVARSRELINYWVAKYVDANSDTGW